MGERHLLDPAMVCGFAHPPEDGTPDREQLDRFRDFLRLIDGAPEDDEGRYIVTEQTMAYVRGEDVPPVPIPQDGET